MKLWSRLSAVDFMNSSMVFAALAVLCLFPLLLIIGAVLGRDVVQSLVHRLGFSQDATNDVMDLFAKGDAPLSTLSWTSIPFLVFSAYAIASTLQAWYQKVFAQPPGGWKSLVFGNLAWVAALIVYLSLSLAAGKALESTGALIVGLVQLTLAILFWWSGAYVLFFGAVSWRALFPAALATTLFYAGLGAFAAVGFSSGVVTYQKTYGSIGTVMVLLSFLIGLGVVVHLGALVGQLYNERGSARAQA
jgi:membrane protein